MLFMILMIIMIILKAIRKADDGNGNDDVPSVSQL